MRKATLIKLLTICVSAGFITSCTCSEGEYARFCASLPFEMQVPQRPSIPERSVCISTYGGNGNGIELNTDAFEAALSDLASKGGGHLVVPAGVWRTGPITLRSNIDLHLEHEAVLVFDPSLDLYPIVNTVYEGLDTRRCESPIHAEGAHDVSITGGGVIDGSGDAWRMVRRSKMNEAQWKAKVASGGYLEADAWYPDQIYKAAQASAGAFGVADSSFDENEIKRFLRPVLISFRDCENVLLEDCLFQNSPAWIIHPFKCRNVIINNIEVRNPAYSQNGDGIDIDSCENVLLLNSSFDCGDDGICVKSGKDEDGRRRAAPCRNLVVSGCTVYNGHGGFVVGSEMSGGVQNVSVSDCRFLGTDVGLRFKSTRGRGGVVEGIWIDGISMTDIQTDAVLFDLFYMGKSAVEAADGQEVEEPALPVDETTPAFRDIHISNIVCAGARRAMYFNGLPEMPVSGISISNCTISSKKGIDIRWSNDVTLNNVAVFAEKGESVTTSHVNNFTMD